MNKTQLLEIARLGIRYKLLDIERTLAAMFHDFPEEFAAKTPPVFVRAVEKPGGNSWPTFAATPGHENGAEPPSKMSKAVRASWSPQRRAEAAARMRARRNHGGAWGTYVYHRVHDYLAKQPKRTDSLEHMRKVLKLQPSALRSALNDHPKLFAKVGVGVYRLVTIVPVKQRARSVAEARQASQPRQGKTGPPAWGDTVWHRMHDALVSAPDHTLPLRELMKGARSTVQATVISAVKMHTDLFERSAPGMYRLKRELSDDDKRQYINS